MKQKKLWTSPQTDFQTFTPQEFIAACTRILLGYKAYGSMLLTGNLYHDTNNNGQWNQGENVTKVNGSVPESASSSPNSVYVSSSVEPVNINDGRYYSNRNIYIIYNPYRNKINGNLYVWQNRYFTSYDRITTAS